MDGWIRVCTTAELLPGESTVAWDGDTPILVVNLDGDFHALEDRCTHEDFELSAGAVDSAEGSIELPPLGEAMRPIIVTLPRADLKKEFPLEFRITSADGRTVIGKRATFLGPITP